MPLWLLSLFDRWLGTGLLYVLGIPLRIFASLVPTTHEIRPRHVFLKMKGGGSLIIALPALLGLRRHYPDAEFILVCTEDAKAYAELTGIFDRYAVIDDTSMLRLFTSSLAALHTSFRALWCVDLEPNSLLAAVFTMLTCARQRIGMIRPEQHARGSAYTIPVAFDPSAPIYIYYDQICEVLQAISVTIQECRASVTAQLPPPDMNKTAGRTIGIAAFTSDFAQTRMMPAQTWGALLAQAFGDSTLNIFIFGSEQNEKTAQQFVDDLQILLPNAQFMNLCGNYPLPQTAALIGLCDEMWAIDSGLLHVSRLLGTPTRSFWGPTMPTQRLRRISDITEQVHYRPFACSPCVAVGTVPPCKGNNLCMITMADPKPDLNPSWTK